MSIKEFIQKNVSVFNNVRLLEPVLNSVIDNAQIELAKFIVEYFEEYKLIADKYLVKNYPNDDEFYEKFIQFHKDFQLELDNQKQTDREIAKFGDHSKISDELFLKIGFLHDLINN